VREVEGGIAHEDGAITLRLGGVEFVIARREWWILRAMSQGNVEAVRRGNPALNRDDWEVAKG
jgi:hypothetical protein